jgi:hypothetical protein
VLDVPAATGVRADLHVRADGTEVMTVCVITTEGDVVCRGGNDTGLLGYGDREPRPGNHRIALPEPVYRVEFRQGDAYAMFGIDTTLMRLWRWAGESALAPVEWLAGVVEFALGNMPMAAQSTWPTQDVRAWGPHRDRLANEDDTEPPWALPTPFIQAPLLDDCGRDVCCFSYSRFLGCWGPHTTWRESPSQPWGAYVPTPGTAADAPYERYLEDHGGLLLRDEVRMAPMPGGGSEVCIGRLIPPDVAAAHRAGGTIPALWCADARRLAELPHSVIDERLRPEPDRYSADGRPASSRSDWDAMCLDLAPNHWRCWGLHEGWGHPPIP